MSRARFLGELHNNADLALLLPFVRLWYSRPSTYTWRDENGTVHNIPQAEGVEQGDPWGPFLFALGFVHVLCFGASWLERHGLLGGVLALMDDLTVVAPLARLAELFPVLSESLQQI